MRRWMLAAVAVTILIVVACSPSGPHALSAPTATPQHALPGHFGSVASPFVGEVFTAGTGSWSKATTGFAYQWERCDTAGANCSNITNATSSVYTVQSADAGDTLRVAVTATFSDSTTARSESAQTGTVPSGSPPANSALPSVSDTTNSGLYETGDTVSASTGTWTNSPTSYSYQWMDEDTPISGATSSTYTLASSDLDHTVDVVVTATNGGGTGAPAPSASSGVVVNPCSVTTSSATTAVSDINSGHSGQTICLSAGTYSLGSITGNNAAMTTLEASPGATVTISNTPTVTANNVRFEGLSLTGGYDDQGSGNINIVANSYVKASLTSDQALWYSSSSDTSGSTQKELHNHMKNVTTDGSTFNDGWGMFGCSASGTQNFVQNYNTFEEMNQHPAQWAGCTTGQVIGNEYLNIWDQYSSQHADCVEVWGGSGATTIQDNRCTTQNPEPNCVANGGNACGSDMLLSGDSGPFTVKNNLFANSPKLCLDMHNNGTSSNGPNNAIVENNTFDSCGFGDLAATDTGSGVSSGNTFDHNIGSWSGTGTCAQFISNGEHDNNGAEPNCPGTNDTNLTPSFASTEPTDSGATYAASNITSGWGYQVGCSSITVCKGRVGSDAHIPVP